jgi:hypothetical protein
MLHFLWFLLLNANITSLASLIFLQEEDFEHVSLKSCRFFHLTEEYRCLSVLWEQHLVRFNLRPFSFLSEAFTSKSHNFFSFFYLYLPMVCFYTDFNNREQRISQSLFFCPNWSLFFVDYIWLCVTIYASTIALHILESSAWRFPTRKTHGI